MTCPLAACIETQAGAQDRREAQRQAVTERNEAIRRAIAAGVERLTVARQYGLSTVTVWKIATRGARAS